MTRTGPAGVCAAPAENHSCTVLGRIKEEKDPDQEETNARAAWGDLPEDHHPPCLLERAGFMRPAPQTIVREHPYAGGWTRSHTHFAQTAFRMGRYSIEAVPFRWVMRDQVEAIARQWGINYDQSLEDEADRYIETSKKTNWVQDYRNQLSLLDPFFSGLVPGRSLVFLYAKDLPLLEDRRPGARVLIGVGRVAEPIRSADEWEYKAKGPVRSIFWERAVSHTIRPTFEDAFLLPYHQLLASESLRGEDLTEFVALAPSDHFAEFSYVSERVGDDGAIAALTELARVVDLLPGVADGPWESVQRWLGDRLAETWEARGAYPGLGSVLAGAGIERGPIIAHRVLESLPAEESNPWPALEQAFRSGGDGPARGLVGRTAGKLWDRVLRDEERYEAALRLAARFSLTVDQARRLLDAKQRGASDSDLLENPYLFYELDRGERDSVGLFTIDRGLFPRSAQARAALAEDPLPGPVEESADDRRVRATAVDALERGADEGHTILDEPTLRRRVSGMPLEPPCDPNDDQFEIAIEDFSPPLVERETEGSEHRAWQLDRLAVASAVISEEVRQTSQKGPLEVDADSRKAIDTAIDQPMPEHGGRSRARDRGGGAGGEGGGAEILARCRSVLSSGRLARARPRCWRPSVTTRGSRLAACCCCHQLGRPRVQFAARTKKPAKTLAQFLGAHGRWDFDSGEYYLAPGTKRFGGAKTVVVDEASMLTEEMLAATIDALTGVDRLILCGDPRQLPPIGAGRPFVDLVAFLRETPGAGGGVAELHTGRRQIDEAGDERLLDDVAVASIFSIDAVLPGADEALARVVAGAGDGRVAILSWQDEAELHQKVIEQLGAEIPDLASHCRGGICRSLGAECKDEGLPSFEWGSAGAGAENWQILSPVRARPGGVAGLNQLIRKTWRGSDPRMALRSRKFTSPLGADQVIFADKVMCLRNDHKRKRWDPAVREQKAGGVANGEIGVIVGGAGKPPNGHRIEFSTQIDSQYTFWDNEMNSGGERAAEWLELAYAVTIHKSQGSQFKITFVVVPDPCPLLSPELLYTALTRQQDKVVLLKQGDLSTLRAFASPSRSETARRLTCLFRPADPFAVGDVVVDGAHVHRTARGDDLVRSKSEVIVADALHDWVSTTPMSRS